MKSDTKHEEAYNPSRLMQEIETLRARLEEAEDTVRAIRSGEVDALLVNGPAGAKVYTLQSAEQPYRILIEQMQEGAVTLSPEGTILYCNLRFAQMLRLAHEKVIASDAEEFVAPPQRSRFAELLKAAATESIRAELRFRTGDGLLLPTIVTINPLPDQFANAICMIVTDLTEQESMRQNQAMIEELNARLRRAMTETHHRVKNSLQIMSALVDLHVMDSGDSIPKSAMCELTRQVRVLATVHDLLTEQSKENAEGDSVPSRELLVKLLDMLEEIAVPHHIRYDIDDVQLSGRQPIAVALVLNELVLNALKHGRGPVEVSFRTIGATGVLEVRDSGAGLPAGFDATEQAGTGMSLVTNLVSWDLQGVVAYANREDRAGARVSVTFPVYTPAAGGTAPG